jgi:hypothetical protein
MTMDHNIDIVTEEPPPPAMTVWTNPTTTTVTFDLVIAGATGWGQNGTPPQRPKVRRVVVKPGETVSLPTEHDDGIQRIRDGRVVAGLAVQLRRATGPTVELDPRLVARPEPVRSSLADRLAKRGSQ